MPLSQCPQCELKFNNQSEMKWHLREDHPTRRTMESVPTTIVLEVARAQDPGPARSGWSRFWQGLRRKHTG